jgi:hypothetical protein
MRNNKMRSFPETGQHSKLGPREKDARMDLRVFFGPLMTQPLIFHVSQTANTRRRIHTGPSEKQDGVAKLTDKYIHSAAGIHRELGRDHPRTVARRIVGHYASHNQKASEVDAAVNADPRTRRKE